MALDVATQILFNQVIASQTNLATAVENLREGVYERLDSLDERMRVANHRTSKNEAAIDVLNDRDQREALHQQSQDRLTEQRSKDESSGRTSDKWLAFLNKLTNNFWFWITVLFLIGATLWAGVFGEIARRVMTKYGY
jgi:hypothetical protein